MANTGRKHQKIRSSRRRLAAISFLSNISLDGTHNDTKLAVYSRKHKRNDVSKEAGENRALWRATWAGKQVAELPQDVSESQESSKDVVEVVGSIVGSTKLQRDGSQLSGSCTEKNTETSSTITPGPKRWRAASLSGERDRQAVKKKLVHLLSEVGVVNKKEFVESAGERSRRSSSLSDNSNESVPKEVRFVSPDCQKALATGRIYYVSQGKVPVAICSVLPYRKNFPFRPELIPDDARPKVRHTSGSRSISSSEGLQSGLIVTVLVEEGQDVSYSKFLVPSRNSLLKRANSDGTAVLNDGTQQLLNHEVLRSISHDSCPLNHRTLDRVPETGVDFYDANILDDPELHSGSYRTLMTFSSYIVSIMDYAKPSVLKKELNEKFRERFPNIQLTLSKLRSLKRELKRIAYVKCQLDLWTIAQAYVYFEKLVLKVGFFLLLISTKHSDALLPQLVMQEPNVRTTFRHLINKQNRKLCAGACLLLSGKLNDIKGEELTKLIETVEEVFKLSRKELLNFEIQCLLALELCLHVPDREVFPHYQRLLYNS